MKPRRTHRPSGRRMGAWAAAVAWGGIALGSAAAVEPGDTAPGFTLTALGGQQHSLDDYRGRVVLLAFVGYD